MMSIQNSHTANCKTARAGFSTMELMVYIMIVGVILAVAVPGFRKVLKNAKIRTARTSLKMLQKSIEMFELHTGVVPERLKDLVRQPVPSSHYEPEMISEWQDGGYLKGDKVPLDPWNSRFKYEMTSGGKHQYELYSYGPNRKGAPKSEWISVWGK